MNKIQDLKFRNLLEYVIQYNDFYKKKYINLTNVCLKSISMESVYRKLPYLCKEELIQNKNVLSLGKRIVRSNTTSGSSGQVLVCYKSLEENIRFANRVWKLRKKIDSLVSFDNYVDLFSDEVESLIGHFYTTDKQDLIVNYNKVMSLNPRWISGPISLIEKFAVLLRNGELEYIPTTLKYIEFMGEYVDIETRKFIEEEFGCKTINHYGMQEVWCIAYDCLDQHLHILNDNFIIEIKNPDSNGFGEVVLTSLDSFSMPFIKYCTGDIGKIYELECKYEKTPVLILRNGRKSAEIYGKNIIGGYLFDQIIWDVNESFPDSIFAYQVIQNAPRLFTFKIVKGSRYNVDIQQIIEKRMKDEIGLNIEIVFKYYESFSYNGKAKFTKFVSYLEYIKGVCHNEDNYFNLS